jgi:hypothetical protein
MLLPGDQIGIKIRPISFYIILVHFVNFFAVNDYRILYLRHRGSKTSNSGGPSPTYSEQKSQIPNDRNDFVWNLKFIHLNLFGTSCLPCTILGTGLGIWCLSLFIAKGFDGVQQRGFPCRIESEKYAHRPRKEKSQKDSFH